MHTVLLAAATLAGVVHVLFFVLEAFLFTGPIGRRVFGTSEADAATMAFLAKNQGFYNVFLALGTFAGVGLVASGRDDAGRAVIAFGCTCMVGAAAVLATGGARYVRGVLAQSVPALVALGALLAS